VGPKWKCFCQDGGRKTLNKRTSSHCVSPDHADVPIWTAIHEFL
jgi:hypothetical protein